MQHNHQNDPEDIFSEVKKCQIKLEEAQIRLCNSVESFSRSPSCPESLASAYSEYRSNLQAVSPTLTFTRESPLLRPSQSPARLAPISWYASNLDEIHTRRLESRFESCLLCLVCRFESFLLCVCIGKRAIWMRYIPIRMVGDWKAGLNIVFCVFCADLNLVLGVFCAGF